MCQKDVCVCFCLWSVHFVNFDEFVFMFLIKFSLCSMLTDFVWFFQFSRRKTELFITI